MLKTIQLRMLTEPQKKKRKTLAKQIVNNEGAVNVTYEIIKSETDLGECRTFELHNRLKVLAVSQPTTEKGAACMNVRVGDTSNPKELLELAHYQQHYSVEEHAERLLTSRYPISRSSNRSGTQFTC